VYLPVRGAAGSGLVANTVLGWWWADPVTALVIAAVAVKEGRDAWRGDDACCAVGAALTANPDRDDGGGSLQCTRSPDSARSPGGGQSTLLRAPRQARQPALAR